MRRRERKKNADKIWGFFPPQCGSGNWHKQVTCRQEECSDGGKLSLSIQVRSFCTRVSARARAGLQLGLDGGSSEGQTRGGKQPSALTLSPTDDLENLMVVRGKMTRWNGLNVWGRVVDSHQIFWENLQAAKPPLCDKQQKMNGWEEALCCEG